MKVLTMIVLSRHRNRNTADGSEVKRGSTEGPCSRGGPSACGARAVFLPRGLLSPAFRLSVSLGTAVGLGPRVPTASPCGAAPGLGRRPAWL